MANNLCQALMQTLNPATQKLGEKSIKALEQDPSAFLNALFALLDNPTIDTTLKLSAAICLKNFVKVTWPQLEDDPTKIPDAVRTAIKGQIVPLLVRINAKPLQLQLSEVIVLIAKEEFPDQWNTLVSDLLSKLSPADFAQNNVVLRTLHSMLKR